MYTLTSCLVSICVIAKGVNIVAMNSFTRRPWMIRAVVIVIPWYTFINCGNVKCFVCIYSNVYCYVYTFVNIRFLVILVD